VVRCIALICDAYDDMSINKRTRTPFLYHTHVSILNADPTQPCIFYAWLVARQSAHKMIKQTDEFAQ
jgi:hypothetical protein